MSFSAGHSKLVPPAAEILEKSIAYHDPENAWESGSFQISLRESRPDGTARLTDIRIDNAMGTFELRQQRGEDQYYPQDWRRRRVRGDAQRQRGVLSGGRETAKSPNPNNPRPPLAF